MKNNRNIIIGLAIVAVVFLRDKSFAQSAGSIDSAKKVLDSLYKSKDPKDMVTLKEGLKKLASGDENEMMLAGNYYYRLKDQRMVDSINHVLPVKFPGGKAARGIGEDSIYKLKTPSEKDAAYKKWIEKFPPANFPDIDYDHISYDYVRASIADDYAAANNTEKAIYFINMLEEEFWKTNGYAGLAQIFDKTGDHKNAELYAKKAMDIAGKYYYAKDNDNAGKFAASGYPGLLSGYAKLLYEDKQYKEALVYIRKSYQLDTEINPYTNYSYAEILMKLDSNKEAYEKLEAVVKIGKANPEMEATFKTLYVKVHGSIKGYDAYAALIRKGYLEDLNKRVNKEMMNVPAADFVLTDLDGNQVTLSKLKGKVVVLDFWATWCGPCKASFPAMQMAQNKYKDDPNVKFLFIHTWERGTTTPAEDAKAFIKSKGYNFEVLMDLKDPETKQNKVVTSYGVDGIPSKFVIDENGIIRFHLLGFDGSNEAAVDELSAMIDLAKKKSSNR
jgi:thiol-disulfide isomerase/thioredoxin